MIHARRRAPSALCSGLVLAGSLTLATAAGAGCLEPVGAWPYGPTFAVAVSGAYAFFGTGATLTVADVSTPADPQVVARLPLSGVVEGIALAGGRAYVAAGTAGLHVVDVTDPLAPALLGSVPLPATPVNAEALDVAVSGSHAYLAAGFAGLRVIDVSDPGSPVEVGSLPYPGPGGTPQARAVDVSGTTVFIADKNYGGGLRVIDVTDPADPTEIILVENDSRDLTVWGQYLLTAEGSDGLRIYDVSNPALPAEVGSFAPAGFVEGVEANGDVAYAFRRHAGAYSVTLVDLSTPSSPAELGSLPTLRRPDGAAFASTVAFVADGPDGLRVVDASTPAAPSEIARVATPAIGSEVTLAGDLALVSYDPGDDRGPGLGVFDVSDPAAPAPLGYLPLAQGPRQIAVAGDRAYVAIGDPGMAIVDLSTPSAPALLGSWEGSPAYFVAAAGDFALVIDTGGLRVVDAGDPADPQSPARLTSPFRWPRSIALAGDYAYVVDFGDDFTPPSLVAVDVSTPSSPFMAGSLPDHSYPEVAPAGPLAFTAEANDTLCVLDLSSPASPTELACFDDPAFNHTSHLVHAGGFVYLTDTRPRQRMAAYDLSAPLAPHLVADFTSYAGNADLATDGDLIYLSADAAGLYVFRGCSIFADGFESGDLSGWSPG